ncbi:hypothetical protein BC628DRAFT_1406677 [Trametes gibbosa]|nr:hypothetical protein BC628DRAFT_1406677 [Trametes gibbosa]
MEAPVEQIPPSVQGILTRRSSNTRSPPPLTELSETLLPTLENARRRSAQTTWVVLTTCTFATVNHQQAIGYVYRLATRKDAEDASTRCGVAEAMETAADMREAILKGIVFIGAPRTIMAMASLHATLEDDVKSGLRKIPLSRPEIQGEGNDVSRRRKLTPENFAEFLLRGVALSESIYGPRIGAVRTSLESSHPDLLEVLEQAYGMILAPLPGDIAVQGNLSRAFVSLVAVACLRAEGGVEQLLHGHVLGLLRAHDVVSNEGQEYWLTSSEGVEWVITTVDAMVAMVLPKLRN